MLPQGLGWAVIRIIGEPKDVQRDAFPRVEMKNGWSVLMGRSRFTGCGHFTTILDGPAWFDVVHSADSPVHGFTYCILSEWELALFVVGPPVDNGGVNIWVEWQGRGDLKIVGPGSVLLPITTRLANGGVTAFVPTLERGEIPINYKGPFGCLEIQTRIFNEHGNVFMRLEQFSRHRLPLPSYTVWRESSKGAYSNYVQNPVVLERMSSAAMTWMFGLREASHGDSFLSFE